MVLMMLEYVKFPVIFIRSSLLLILFYLLPLNAVADYSYRAGGLLAYPKPIVTGNILINSDFEEIDFLSGQPVGWKLSKAFSVNFDENINSNVLMLNNAPAFPYSESASQDVFLHKGVYRLGGKIKTELEDAKNKGVRISLRKAASTQVFSHISEWEHIENNSIFIPESGKYYFAIEAYNEPSGSALFDDVYLKRELYPVEFFVKYPNYRGMLFDDQSQIIQVAVNVDSFGLEKNVQFVTEISMIDEASGATIYSREHAGDFAFVEDIDGSALDIGGSYLIRARLFSKRNPDPVYEHPNYRIVKLNGELRKKMVVAFDEHNRFLTYGQPTFFLGVYDSGMGYIADKSRWMKVFDDNRRLFELPINLYLNYWYGIASLQAMQSMMDALQSKKIYYFQTGNAFAHGYDPNYFAIDTSEIFLEALSKHSGLAGFYTVDEAVSSLAPVMFEQYQRLKSVKPDGITFGAFLHTSGLRFWRDTVDVLAMDPYPIVGKEPATGYDLSLVANWTRATRDVVMDSRPIMSVLQFFQTTSDSRWPTKDELRNMSYMAIAEGANGLMYWSLGVRALAHVCKDWCEEKEAYFENLKSVLTELKGLENVLVGIDKPDLLILNSLPKLISTRIKFMDGKVYLIASNLSPIKQEVDFGFGKSIKHVSVYLEGRSIAANGSIFSDSFAPCEAHVYEVVFIDE